jgi:hypothetical protein
MKLIDCAAEYEKRGKGKSLDSIVSSFKAGRGRSHDPKSEETVIAAFQRMVDNKFFMLRNVALKGMDGLIPLVLVGPPGVWMIYPSGLRGVYRAVGESWEIIDERRQTYKPAGENLISKADQMAQALQDYLLSQGIRYPQVVPALVFTNPGIHVETVRPVVRIVLIDALNRFMAGLVQGRLINDQEQIQKMVDLLTSPPEERGDLAEPGETGDALFANGHTRPGGGSGKGQVNLERIDTAFSRVEKLPFSSRQWIVLIVLILINVVVLLAFVIYLVFLT